MAKPHYTLAQEVDGPRCWLILRAGSVVFRIAEDEAGFARDTFDNLQAGRRWASEMEIEVESESLEDSDDLASSA